MGANLQFKQFDSLAIDEVTTAYLEYVEQLESEYGNEPYSGQLCSLPTNVFFCQDISFETLEEALEWLSENHEKWEAPFGIKLLNNWLIGGWCPN